MWQRRGEWHPFLTCRGDCLGWGFSCPTPTRGNPNNKTGLQAFRNRSGWSKLPRLHLPGNSEPSQEWRCSSEAGSGASPGALIHCLLQKTVLQCQSHKTKGRRRIQKTALSDPTEVAPASHGQEPRPGAQRRKVWVRGMPGILMTSKEAMWTFTIIAFMCQKYQVTLLECLSNTNGYFF